MMTKKYKRLTYDERIEIYKLLALKQILAQIGQALFINLQYKTTVSLSHSTFTFWLINVSIDLPE